MTDLAAPAPAPEGELLTRLSGRALAHAIATRSVTSREVTQEHIFTLQRHRALNAIAQDRFAAALAEAEAVDERVRRGTAGDPLPPLLGVPITVKELIAVEGMPNSAGFPHRRHHRAGADAPAVARLKAAGAIVLGVTNASGPFFWVETNNPLYGRANNAYDPRRSAGGSSGGDGAAVAVGGAPIALASDMGGSLRIPAFFNGVFAHMPSVGLVPNTGHFPMAIGEMRKTLFLGPITRRAEDLAPVLRIIAGPDADDPYSRLLTLRDPATVDLHGLPVILSVDSSLTRTLPELDAARAYAAEVLEHAGARVRELSLTALRWTLAQSVAAASANTDFAGTIADFLGTASHTESVRAAALHKLVPMLMAAPLAVLRLAELAPAKAVRTLTAKRLLSAATKASDDIRAAIGPGVLLHPPFPRLAPRHYTTYGQPWLLANTIAFNVMGLPVTQVPLGLGKQGLPLGVQVAAAPGNDHVTIRVALELERVLGGWVPPGSA